MYYKYVTFCGHRDLPDRAAVEAWLRRTLPCLYAQGARRFYVGGYGAFDAAAAAATLALRAAHPEVEVVLVRPYLDAGPAPQPGMASVYPPLERVPRRFAIARRNRWMVDHSDMMICYVREGSTGGAEKTLRYAERRGIEIFRL